MANVSDIIKQLERDGERADEQERNMRRAERLKREEEKRRERLWDEVHGQ